MTTNFRTVPKIGVAAIQIDIVPESLGRNFLFVFSSRRRHTRSLRDWSSDVCSFRSGGTGLQKEVLLGAIFQSNGQMMLSSAGQIGADLTHPSALSWYDADHLLVVNQVPP